MAKNWQPDQAATQVHAIYQQILERSAENGGLITWGCILVRGEQSIRELVARVGKSQEYHDRFIAPVGAREAAVLMYRHFLAREPENAIVIDQHAAAIIANPQAAVDNFVYSVEYTQRFGDDVVPHS
jgi:hypothetical protein